MPALTSMTDIRAAFERSQLVDIGFTFEDAMNIDPIRRALTCAADARRRRLDAIKDEMEKSRQRAMLREQKQTQKRSQLPLAESLTGGITA